MNSSSGRTRQRRRIIAAAARVAATLTAAVVFAVLTGDVPALAQEQVQVVALAATVGQVLDNIRNFVVGLLAALATVFLTIGGARYIMAGGDAGEVERARAALRSAAFGYALAALAPLVVEVLKQIVGA